jgi:hypothetical protein
MVVMVDVGGSLVAADPEVIRVVRPGGVEGARRMHVDMCDTYVEQGRKARLRAEHRDFNRKRKFGV